MAKLEGKAARRYAQALLEVYPPTDLESVRDSLSSCAQHWEDRAELRLGLLNPAFSVEDRISVGAAVAKRIRAGDEKFENFISLLVENGRIALLPQISKSFAILVDILKKRLALEIVSAFPLEQSEQSEIKEKIEKNFGSMASIQWDVRPELLGGLMIKAGDKLLDTSVNGALESLRESLLD